MKPNKKFATVATAALAIGGLAAVAAPSAQAYGPASSTINCRLYFSDAGTGTSPTPYTDTFSLTQSPAAPANGATVTVTMTGATGPSTGPLPIAADGQTVRVTAGLSGAQTGTVNLVSGPGYPATAIGPTTPTGAWSASGTYTANAGGQATVAFQEVKFDDDAAKPGYSGSNVDNYCADAPDQDFKAASAASLTSTTIVAAPAAAVSINSITGQAAGVTGYARSLTPGFGVTVNVLNVTGSGFGASKVNGDFTASVGGVAATITALSTDAGGDLTGTVTVPPGVPAGSALVSISDDEANVSNNTITILGPRGISISPAAGGAGTTVNVTGSNFNPLEAITAQAQLPNPNGLCALPGGATTAPCLTPPGNFVVGPFINGTNVTVSGQNASATGTVGSLGVTSSLQVVVNDPLTTLVSVIGTPAGASTAATAGFAYSNVNNNCDATAAACSTQQELKLQVQPGTLSQWALCSGVPAADLTSACNGNPNSVTVDFGAFNTEAADNTVSNADGSITVGSDEIARALNPIRVTDARGGLDIWSLTADLPNLADGAKTITADNVTVNPTCTGIGATSGPGITAGANGQDFGSQVTLCNNDGTANITTSSSSGVYEITGQLGLVIPAFQATGNYSSIMQITLT